MLQASYKPYKLLLRFQTNAVICFSELYCVEKSNCLNKLVLLHFLGQACFLICLNSGGLLIEITFRHMVEQM